LRVLWVTNMFHEDGAPSARGIFVRQQYDALAATGRVELDRVLVAQGRGAADYLLANRRVQEKWDRGGFDLLHVHYGLTGLATLLLPASARRVFTFYGSDINNRVQRTISVATARRAGRRIFVSRRLADAWPDARNAVIPNGVDFSRCAPRERAAARAALGLPESGRRVLFGAHPSNPVKGWDVFRAVVDRVRERFPDVEPLVLTEPGQPYERVVDKLNAADVLLFTSRRGSEGSPTVVKEALAVGLPVVATDVGDTAEMLADVSPGGVVPWPADDGRSAPADVAGKPPVDHAAWLERLADATASVLAQPRRSDGREKRAFLRQEEIVRRLLRVYDDVAGADPGRPHADRTVGT